MRRALALALGLCGHAARAGVTVDVNLTPAGASLAREMGVSSDQLAQRLRDRINSVVGSDGAALQAFSDAAVLSSHGLGVDYVSVPESLVVGVAASAASERTELAPFAPNVTAMAGLNLSVFGLPRWTVYGSGFYRSDTVAGVEAAITNGAAHVQYALIAAPPGTVARWTGLQLTTGLEMTRWTLRTDETMGTTFTLEGHTFGYDMTGHFQLGSSSLAVPLELSTGVRVAVISLYAGVGVDLAEGQGTIDARLTGPVHDTDGRELGTVTITGHDSGGASPVTARALGGVQIDAWKLKIVGHVNVAAGAATSVAIAIRGVL